MATLLLERPGAPPRPVRLFRALTTIGSSRECDVSLADAGLEPVHAQIRQEDGGHVIVGMLRDMTVNGRREKETRLPDQAEVRIGQLVMRYFVRDEDVPHRRGEEPPEPPPTATSEVVNAYRRLHGFSMELLSDASTEQLVETLLDGVIELTGADKGFLILIEEGTPQVGCARNLRHESIARSAAQLSDSILRRVVETKRPLLVHDAMAHEEWSASESVVSLGLHGVICVPLMDGPEVRGLLYVGNDRVGKVFDVAALELSVVFAGQASLLLAQRRRFEELTREKAALQSEIEDIRQGDIIGSCDSMQEVFRRIRKVATTDISVLVTGETGTGKELVAQQIHRQSRRSTGPFVVINCGAIPENLLESELFGHVRGAFTGAVADRKGRFQLADKGTLFLDEIGEMPMPLQVKLLRALQERVVTPVGGTRDEAVDIRVVAATNRDLEKEVAEGRFREDLYYRLDVVSIHLPPLRERGADLELIAKFLLASASKAVDRRFRGFSKAALVAMRKYRWPGNVRELENRIRKATVLAEGNLVTAEDLDIQAEDLEEVLPLAEAKERFQRRYVQRILERNGGNRTQAAKELGVDPRTVFRHLEKIADPLPPEDGLVGLDADGLEPTR